MRAASIDLRIEDVISAAEELGVDLEIDTELLPEENALWLSSIRRNCARRGSGAEALTMLLELCEDEGLRLEGAIEPPNQNLENYYADLGFHLAADGQRTLIAYAP